MLTIVKPLQQKQKRGGKAGGQVSIEDVLCARMAFERYEQEHEEERRRKMEVSRLLAKYLGGRRSEEESEMEGISELQRCRLRACLYTMANTLVAYGFSQDITNSGDKSLGLFATHKISQNGFCSNGQWKTLITSQYYICPKKTVPKFVVELPNQMVCARDFFSAHFGAQFAQVDSGTMEVHNGVFAFDIPAQNAAVMEILSSYHINLLITLFRSSDCTFAQNPQPFRYFPHADQSCAFCSMKNVLESPENLEKLEMPKSVWTEEDWEDSLEVLQKMANSTSGFESLESRTLTPKYRRPRKRKELPKSFMNDAFTSDEESVKKVKMSEDEIIVIETEQVESMFHPKKTIAARITGLFSKMKIGKAYKHFAYSV